MKSTALEGKFRLMKHDQLSGAIDLYHYEDCCRWAQAQECLLTKQAFRRIPEIDFIATRSVIQQFSNQGTSAKRLIAKQAKCLSQCMAVIV